MHDEPSAQTGTHRSPFILIGGHSRRLFIQLARQSPLPFFFSSATPSPSHQHSLSSIQTIKFKPIWPSASAPRPLLLPQGLQKKHEITGHRVEQQVKISAIMLRLFAFRLSAAKLIEIICKMPLLFAERN